MERLHLRLDCISRFRRPGRATRWFSVTRDGEGADRAGWFLVQHADDDREFQHAMILKIEPLALAGESSLNRFSYP